MQHHLHRTISKQPISKTFFTAFTQASLGLLLLTGMTAPLVSLVGFPEPAIAQKPAAQRKKVVIVDFDFANTSDSSYWYGYRGGGAARGISELMINKLVNDGSFVVTSRSALENYLRDQKISGAIDEANAVKIGKALGVDAVIVGTVTRFNIETRRSGGSFFGVGGGSEKTKAVVQLTTRIVDTKSQSIIAAMSGTGESSNSGANASVAGVFSGGSNAGNTDELLSNAADEAVMKVVEEMKRKL
jgi:curli biogenesis system outer membrane secretion channel CsgG